MIATDTGLVRLDAARRALSEARTLEEIKGVRDQAEAIRSYMKAQGYSLEMQNDCAEIGIRAERAMGELLKPIVQHGGDRRSALSKTRVGFLKENDIDDHISARAQLVADVPEETFEQHIAETKAAKRELSHTGVYRVAKEQKRAEQREANQALVTTPPPLPPAIFQTIVLDPPWDWGDEGDVSQFGRGDPTYATMGIEELLALPVANLAESNAHIYLWITNRSLPKGFQLLERWGFRYVTALTWCKPSIGMGNYFRGSTEHVLFGVRGSLPLLRRDVGTWFEWPRGSRHSDKPAAFFDLVQECSPGPWLEMFARAPNRFVLFHHASSRGRLGPGDVERHRAKSSFPHGGKEQTNDANRDSQTPHHAVRGVTFPGQQVLSDGGCRLRRRRALVGPSRLYIAGARGLWPDAQ